MTIAAAEYDKKVDDNATVIVKMGFCNKHYDYNYDCRQIVASTGEVIWRNPFVTSPCGMRPYFSFPIKENQETQHHIHHSFLNKEIEEVEAATVEHSIGNLTVEVSNEILPYLMDGKVRRWKWTAY